VVVGQSPAHGGACVCAVQLLECSRAARRLLGEGAGCLEARLGVAQGLSNGAAERAESYGQGSSGTCSGSWRAGFCVVYNFL
jgi:hypothetical protein